MTWRALTVSSAMSALASTPISPKKGPSDAASQASTYGVLPSDVPPVKSTETDWWLSGEEKATIATRIVAPTVMTNSRLTPMLLTIVAKRTPYRLMSMQTAITPMATRICAVWLMFQPNRLPR